MDRFEQIIAIRRQLFALDKKKTNMEEKEMENPCQSGYIAYGTKEKDGRTVPNCVPDPEQMNKIVKEGFPIPSPEGNEDENTFIGRCVSSIIDEYEQPVALGICYSQWEKK